jgi:gamma-glutamyltranspeptidase/glutathione hydrolase
MRIEVPTGVKALVTGWRLVIAFLVAACSGTGQGGIPMASPSTNVDAEAARQWPFRISAMPARADHGMVATESETATLVGAEVLRNGGSAIDAAIATVFALAVAYPAAGNVAGGGFLVARMHDGTTTSLDFRERAPGSAERTMFAGTRGELGGRSRTGHLAAGVPGTVAGMWAAHQRFGTRPWAELLAPAIRLAEEGVIVDEYTATTLEEHAARLRQYPASVTVFFRNGVPLRAGTRWRNPELARVLRRIAANGREGFYRGETAELLVMEMLRGGGIITRDDLQSYEAKWREPVEFDYRGAHVISMPPPSSGGITLGLISHILEAYDLRAAGWNSPLAIHLGAEAMRRAYAVRNEVLGDPDFVNVPRDRLLSPQFANDLRASISAERATPSTRVSGRTGAASEGKHTTHLSIIDAKGNAVSVTTTLNNDFGSAVTVAGAGFLLNNEMDDFTAEPGVANGFGLVQGEANAIAPGKRPLSSMAPTIVVGRNGLPLLVTGAGGGSRIISAVFQVMSNVLDHGMDLSSAVAAPRMHHQHLPDSIDLERHSFSEETQAALKRLGHSIHLVDKNAYVTPILRMGSGWVGVNDPRVGGHAAGY